MLTVEFDSFDGKLEQRKRSNSVSFRYVLTALEASSVGLKKFLEVFCITTADQKRRGNASILSQLLKAASDMQQSTEFQPTETQGDGNIDTAIEDECDRVDPELVVDVLLLLTFECLDNLVYLEHHFNFTDLLNKLPKAKKYSNYMPQNLGISSIILMFCLYDRYFSFQFAYIN